eukprot:TRINITY_DN11300_c0_g1_i1.p1 TRINITY_DN11300_c0_g1~~TRINITY_DN11300_c0_g1_i1.p1  ORF type:complete len:524 (-),score=77.39 TRINITY_DN11300_c0_g1_i1:39-1487(-)
MVAAPAVEAPAATARWALGLRAVVSGPSATEEDVSADGGPRPDPDSVPRPPPHSRAVTMIGRRPPVGGNAHGCGGSKEDPLSLPGATAAVKARCAGGWTLGRVAPPTKPGRITVEFAHEGTRHRKTFRGGSKHVRVLSQVNFEEEDHSELWPQQPPLSARRVVPPVRQSSVGMVVGLGRTASPNKRCAFGRRSASSGCMRNTGKVEHEMALAEVADDREVKESYVEFDQPKMRHHGSCLCHTPAATVSWSVDEERTDEIEAGELTEDFAEVDPETFLDPFNNLFKTPRASRDHGGRKSSARPFGGIGGARGTSASAGSRLPISQPLRNHRPQDADDEGELLLVDGADLLKCAQDLRTGLEVSSRESSSPWLAGVEMLGGVHYYGDLRPGGVPHGSGRMVWPDGREYFGVFRDGDRVSGTMIWKDGRMYTGLWKNGQPHGRGTSYCANGNRWTGDWLDGRPLVEERRKKEDDRNLDYDHRRSL